MIAESSSSTCAARNHFGTKLRTAREAVEGWNPGDQVHIQGPRFQDFAPCQTDGARCSKPIDEEDQSISPFAAADKTRPPSPDRATRNVRRKVLCVGGVEEPERARRNVTEMMDLLERQDVRLVTFIPLEGMESDGPRRSPEDGGAGP
jgi:hypothetical protein